MNRIILILFLAGSFSEIKAQLVPAGEIVTDTIYLGDFHPKKVVTYKFRTVTFYLDYDASRQVFDELVERWNQFLADNSIDSSEQTDPGSYEESTEFCNRKLKRSFDSTLKLLNDGAGTPDTIFLTQDVYDNCGPEPREPLQDFLPDQLERRLCVIRDDQNVLQNKIVRQKGEWRYPGSKSSYKGRRYFIPGRSEYFIEGVDEIIN